MNYKNLQKITLNCALVLGLAVMTAFPVAAQNNSNSNNRVETTRVVEKDNGFDWGWLGLLGLLGLTGLLTKKRDVEVQQFRDVRTDQTGQTGSGTGTNN